MSETPRTDELFEDCGDADCSSQQTIGAVMGLCRQLESELTAALARAAHMERALDAVCKHCWSLADGPYIKAWALKKAEDAK